MEEGAEKGRAVWKKAGGLWTAMGAAGRPLWLRPALSIPPALVEDLLRSGGTSSHTVSGGWAAWGPWSSCSRDCELGFRVRKRTCTNPEPRNGGLPCVGDAAEYQDCNPQACPGNPPLRNFGHGNPPRPGNPDLGDSQVYAGGYNSCLKTFPPSRLSTRQGGPHRVTFCPEHGHSNSPPPPPTTPGRFLTLWVA